MKRVTTGHLFGGEGTMQKVRCESRSVASKAQESIKCLAGGDIRVIIV